jgi:2-polyprenyl-3-methyl-5-hydroxy-6-metoxy-1,4-benzoquinol methylase
VELIQLRWPTRPRTFTAMEPADDTIVRHYQTHHEEARISEGYGRLELLRAQEVLRRHLPRPPAKVLDVGGATGVHAQWLATDGYQVHLIDLAPRHVAKTNADLGQLGVTAEVGDARHLQVADSSYDVVLLFGPLYHLTERQDRLCSLREAARVVRPAGVVAVAAVSRVRLLVRRPGAPVPLRPRVPVYSDPGPEGRAAPQPGRAARMVDNRLLP